MAQYKLVPITPPDIKNYRPGHTEGDTDFHGHGPYVHIVTEVQRKGNLLVLATSAFFQETESDWTTFEDAFSYTFYDVHNQHPGWRIKSIHGYLYQSFESILTGYGTHVHEFGIGGLVRSLRLNGDSDGGAFGGDDNPAIQALTFNEIEVKLVK